jgi:tRNA dimethylallyltransferase
MGIARRHGKDSGVAPVIVIAGPTASGKSAAALAVAEAFSGTVINADSMQVYRELPVLTAQPSPAETGRAPHRLYGVLPAAERCTAGRWREMALAEIEAAHGAGRLPIVVGGTGLYLKALMEGLAAVPPVPPEIRAETAARHESLGTAAFHAELARLDPAMAARLAPGDTQRVRRAYEVVIATGRSIAAFHQDMEPAPYRFVPLLLMPPRDILYQACDRRCQAMVDAGALDEARALIAQGLDPALPAMKAVGVRELARHLSGELEFAAALDLFQRATRQYAKRQYTWFRYQLRAAQGWDAQYSESIGPEIFSFIRNCVDHADSTV